MPDLSIQVQEVKGVPGTALVVLNGSIDAKTVITFQTHLNSVKERGMDRFILDMENVKYVNSTGLGYLINLSDSSGPERGGISLVKVQPKVKVVFDMLGLNAFFKIYNSREDALRHFAAEPGATAPVERAADRTVVVKTPVPPPPPPRPVAHAPSPLPLSAPEASASLAPLHIECQFCRALLAVREAGNYKCPRCFALFHYLGGGRVTFLPRQKAVPVQLSLNFAPEYTEGLLEFVKRAAGKAGFSPYGVSEVQSAVRHTVEAIHRHAYGGNDNIYHVLLVSRDSELDISFADTGASLNSDRGDLFGAVRRVVDRFELKGNPRGGNVVTMTKKAR